LIKCHCSDAGKCSESQYEDTDFNFLPKYADERMGILPHTVQTFSMTDPTSGTYNKGDFKELMKFAIDVAREQPDRRNVYYPETAYW